MAKRSVAKGAVSKQYVKLASKCYFVSPAGYIVKDDGKAPVKNLKLTTMDTFIARFLILQVERRTVAAILEDHYGMSPKAALDKVDTVIKELEGFKVIKRSNKAELHSGSAVEREQTTLTYAASITPFWPTSPKIF